MLLSCKHSSTCPHGARFASTFVLQAFSLPTTFQLFINARSACFCYAFGVAAADTGTEDIIPLPNVPGKILAKVIEYCKFHVEANKKVDDKPAKSEDDIKQWDTEFVKVDQATLFDLILVSEVRTVGKTLCVVRAAQPAYTAVHTSL
jgi:hypothetical protein